MSNHTSEPDLEELLVRITNALERIADVFERQERRDAARAMADASIPAPHLRPVA